MFPTVYTETYEFMFLRAEVVLFNSMRLKKNGINWDKFTFYQQEFPESRVYYQTAKKGSISGKELELSTPLINNQ